MNDRRLSTSCKNPLCNNLISPIKRRNNTNGRSEYCTRDCYYTWSPGMDATYQRLVRLKGLKHVEDPRAFMKAVLIETLQKFPTWTARAALLGVKRQTYWRWLKHFGVVYEKKKRGVTA